MKTVNFELDESLYNRLDKYFHLYNDENLPTKTSLMRYIFNRIIESDEDEKEEYYKDYVKYEREYDYENKKRFCIKRRKKDEEQENKPLKRKILRFTWKVAQKYYEDKDSEIKEFVHFAIEDFLNNKEEDI